MIRKIPTCPSLPCRIWRAVERNGKLSYAVYAVVVLAGVIAANLQG